MEIIRGNGASCKCQHEPAGRPSFVRNPHGQQGYIGQILGRLGKKYGQGGSKLGEGSENNLGEFGGVWEKHVGLGRWRGRKSNGLRH